ncbi:MAG: response regulator [Chthoniobacterales bacterium]|nr:response regulator [Chthoniobacterales bacterium]
MNPSLTSVPPNSFSSALTAKPRVLIVDDEAELPKLVKVAVSRYDICNETDSRRALATARHFQPDLILLDVMMPHLDGGDVAAQIRSDPHLKFVPIVFFTGLVTAGETTKHPFFGGYPFIAKPQTPQKLAEQIDRHLAG